MELTLLLFLNKTKPNWISWNLNQTSVCSKINGPEQNWKIKTSFIENTISSDFVGPGCFMFLKKWEKTKYGNNNYTLKDIQKK